MSILELATPLDGVKAQLAKDYPEKALDWLDDVEWELPKTVQLNTIDYDDNIFDRTATEHKKVAAFAKRIKAGWRKPVVLLKRPGVPLLKALDGHTRLTAYKKVNTPAYAWVGTAKKVKGPWDDFHKKQFQTANTVSGQIIELERVETAAGAAWFNDPIGSLIVRHTHQELLDARRELQALHPRSDPRVKKIRAAVVKSRDMPDRTPSAGPVKHDQSWKERVNGLPKDSFTDDAIQSAMQNAHDAGFREEWHDDGEAFWKEVHDQVIERLSEKVQADQRAKTEAENKARFPGGSVTEYKDIKAGAPDPATDRGMTASGRRAAVRAQEQVTVDPHAKGVHDYLYDSAQRSIMAAKIRSDLSHQAQFVPNIVKDIHVNVATPDQTLKKGVKGTSGGYVGGVNSRGDIITIHPKLNALPGKGNNESSGYHVPTDSGYDRLSTTLGHEVGHSVHRRLPLGGNSQELWDTLAAKMGLAPPKLYETTVQEMRDQYPEAKGAIKDMLDELTQEKVDRSNGMVNRGQLNKWIKEHEAAIAKEVSTYGSSNTSELLAELWTEASMNQHPRPVAKAYLDYVKTHELPEEQQI